MNPKKKRFNMPHETEVKPKTELTSAQKTSFGIVGAAMLTVLLMCGGLSWYASILFSIILILSSCAGPIMFRTIFLVAVLSVMQDTVLAFFHDNSISSPFVENVFGFVKKAGFAKVTLILFTVQFFLISFIRSITGSFRAEPEKNPSNEFLKWFPRN